MNSRCVLARPVGCRSCRTPDGEAGHGGEWQKCDRPIGSTHQDDLQRCLEGLPPVPRRFFIAEMHLLMQRAERGDLVLDRPTTKGGDVVQCGLHLGVTRVLEARMHKQVGEEGEQLTRLYYSEPEHEHRQLLWLSLQWKRPGPLGLDEQDGHIREAERRLGVHFGEGDL